eukprot:TRINITY_DN1647_c1_g2_i2.p1 TRINITY_DN1647_c1_g2~~TRINITY_DN1647_c1_g2_i2.p1  ORF type:complete len:1256 (+),score=315.28 TRINITY_DN1647_c1_g2_i2:25-3768(+)
MACGCCQRSEAPKRRASYLGAEVEGFAEPRTVQIGVADVTQRSNKVRTTKYTYWNFLPKNLFEQFHRAAYVYFAVLVVLNFMPQLEVFAPVASVLPLVFVLMFGATKDFYEDHRRRKQDRETNAQPTHVRNEDGTWTEVMMGDVHVGDVIRVDRGRVVPADVVLLETENESTASIDTSGLDGETNLKPRGSYGKIPTSETVVRCGENYPSLAQLDATICPPGDAEYTAPTTMLLPRGSVLRLPGWAAGVVCYTGKDTKILLGTTRPDPKVSRLDVLMNWHVSCLCVLLAMLCASCGVGAWDFWENTAQLWLGAARRADYYTTVPGESVKATLMSVIMLQVMVPIALYVSLDVVKLFHAYLMQQDLKLYCDEQERGLGVRTLNVADDLGLLGQVFSDKTGTLTANLMTFREAYACGTQSALGPGTAGADAVELNEAGAALRAAEGGVAVVGAGFSRCSSSAGDLELDKPELADPPRPSEVWYDVGASAAGARGGSEDASSPPPRGPPPNTPAVTLASSPQRCSASRSESLDGGTSTSVSKKLMWDGGYLCMPDVNKRVKLDVGPERVRSLVGLKHLADACGADTNIDDAVVAKEAETFLYTCISLCHTARPSQDGTDFEGESADEVALLRAAKAFGGGLTRRASRLQGGPRSHDRMFVAGYSEAWRVVTTLFFTSDRRRMSVVVEEPVSGTHWVVCKGADTAVEPLCSAASRELEWPGASEAVERFAARGLRTLVVACRRVPREVAEECERELQHNSGDIVAIEKAASMLEKDMSLVGVTGVEDSLRPGTCEAISCLRGANIGVWILTGDKVGTAQHIAVVCGLVPRDGRVEMLSDQWWDRAESAADRILDLAGKVHAVAMTGDHFAEHAGSPAAIARRVSEKVARKKARTLCCVSSEERSLEDPDAAGREIVLALIEMCEKGKACVMVCRATPSQKQDVVRLYRSLRPRVVCAAVGDGANDVAMLRKAHLGIGITGNEGRQAELASDYALPVFAGMVPLVLVHGHWMYYRIGWTILYFLYKAVLLSMVLYWYQIHSGFSQTTAIDEWSLVLFNMIYTVLPGVCHAVFDQHCPRPVLESTPSIHPGPSDTTYSHGAFFALMADTMWQGTVCHYVPMIARLHYGTLYDLGVLQCCAAVIAINSVPLVDGRYITLPTFGISIGSSASYFVLTYIVHELVGETMPYGFQVRLTFSDGYSWLVLLLTVVLALLPHVAHRVGKLALCPPRAEVARAEYIKGKVGALTEGQQEA